MQAAAPQPEPPRGSATLLHAVPMPAPRAPSRVQALAVLLVLPLALIATAVIVRPPSVAARPEVLVVGPVAGTGWAHGSLDGLGPIVLSSTTARDHPLPSRTEIHYTGPDGRAQAEAVRRSLGRGTLVPARTLEQGFPVVVYIGKDAPHP